MLEGTRDPQILTRYVPILKAKEGEFRALGELDASIKASIVPIFEVPSIPWDYVADAPAKGIDAHLSPVIEKVRVAWGGAQLAYLDVDLLPDDSLATGQHAVDALFAEAASANLLLVPVAGLERPASEIAAIAAVVGRDGRGLCLRLIPDDFVSNTGRPLLARIDQVLSDIGVVPVDVDLVLDVGSIPTGQVGVLTIAWSTIISSLPYLTRWRTFAFAATAFPATLAGISTGITPISRDEWTLYQRLIGTGLPRDPDFGDYAIAHPELSDIDPRLMQMSASIRYTTETEWLIVKGRSVKREGFEQTLALARLLLTRAEARPSAHCPGCGYIRRRAAGATSPGNATTWRRIGTVHHLSTVVRQLANFPDP